MGIKSASFGLVALASIGGTAAAEGESGNQLYGHIAFKNVRVADAALYRVSVPEDADLAVAQSFIDARFVTLEEEHCNSANDDEPLALCFDAHRGAVDPVGLMGLRPTSPSVLVNIFNTDQSGECSVEMTGRILDVQCAGTEDTGPMSFTLEAFR